MLCSSVLKCDTVCVTTTREWDYSASFLRELLFYLLCEAFCFRRRSMGVIARNFCAKKNWRDNGLARLPAFIHERRNPGL
jgi:hypothetical protein